MFSLFSDGGADRGGHAAAAAILELPDHSRRHVVVHLGEATNNEAEIAGLLVGLAAISHFAATPPPVEWFADSEYTILGATQYIRNWEKNGWKTAQKEPVKNQGLWRVYLKFSRLVKLHANHVRGHTGHPENEACDAACNWLKSHASANGGDVSSEFVVLPTDDESWLITDGTAALECARSFQSDNTECLEEAFELFQEITAPLRDQSVGGKATPSPERFYTRALSEITAFRDRIAKMSGDEGARNEVVAELDSLIRNYKKKC